MMMTEYFVTALMLSVRNTQQYVKIMERRQGLKYVINLKSVTKIKIQATTNIYIQ
jgi:hypothetical protein